MGNGAGKLRKQHEEEMEALREQHEKEVEALAEKHKEEIKQQEVAKGEVETKLTAKWKETVDKVTAARKAQERAEEDARLMRLKAIDREDLEDEVVKLTKEKRRLENKIAELEEKLRLNAIVYEGQKDILKKQKHDAEEEAKEEIRRASVAFEREKQELLQKQAEVEAEREKLRNEVRIQAEASIALQSLQPHGTSIPTLS